MVDIEALIGQVNKRIETQGLNSSSCENDICRIGRRCYIDVLAFNLGANLGEVQGALEVLGRVCPHALAGVDFTIRLEANPYRVENLTSDVREALRRYNLGL